MDNALEEVQQAGTLLSVAGAVMMVLYGLFALLGLIGLLFTCMGSGFTMLSLLGEDGAASLVTVGWYGWLLVLQLIGVVLYTALAGAAFTVFSAGSSLKGLQDLEGVKKGMLLAAAVPVIGLIANIGLSVFTLALCGVISYTVPQLIVLALGAAAAYLTNQALQNEDIVSQFSD